MEKKSEGILRYEREMGVLEERIRRQEISGMDQINSEVARILSEARPNMTQGEWDRIQAHVLAAHGVGASILSEHGISIPGNDPKKPN